MTETFASRKPPPTILLAALTALTALSIDMSLPSLPQLEKAFGADVATTQLTLSLFLLGYAAGQLVCGPLSDRLGRRPVLLWGLVLFTLAGIGCALSSSLALLIGFRCLQGMGASVGPVLGRAMVRDLFEGHQASGVLSQITQVMVIAPLIAPTMGGYLLLWFGWPAIFCVLACSGAFLWLICRFFLSETLQEKQSATNQWTHLRNGFVSVVAHRASARHILTICFSYAGMFAYISGSPFIFIDGFGVAKERFGLFFAATAAFLLLGATVNRALLPRVGLAFPLRIGVLCVFAAGISLLFFALLRFGGLAGVLAPMMLYMFGLGLVQPNATAKAMEPHPRLAGVVSSLIGALQTSGGALAGYVVGAFYDHTPRSLAVTVALLAACSFAVAERK